MSSRTDDTRADWASVGTVVKAHGIRGEVVVLPETDNQSRFAPGQQLSSAAGTFTIRRTVATERGLLVSFAEVADRNQAEALVGEELLVPAAARRPLARGEFWPDQLIGLQARTSEGAVVGNVTHVDDRTSQVRLVINDGEFEVPFVDDLVPEVNLDAGYLVIVSIPGLRELEVDDDSPV